MELNHADDSLLHFNCSLDSCPKVYSNVVAYRKHLSRAHYAHWNMSVSKREMSLDMQSPEVDGESSIAQPNGAETSAEVNDDDIDNDLGYSNISQIKQEVGLGIALAYLKTREVHKLPKTVAASIISDIHSLLDSCQIGLETVIRDRLQILGFDYNCDPILSEALESDPLFDEAFSVIASDSHFSNFCKDHLNFIEPVPIYVNKSCGVTTKFSRSLCLSCQNLATLSFSH